MTDSITDLFRLPLASLDALLAEKERAGEDFPEMAEHKLLQREMVRLLPKIFESLDGAALQDLSAAFRWLRLDRGETLFAEGAPGDAVYVVASGRLQAQVLDAKTGMPRRVGEIAPGETVGEMALVTGEARSATVVALRASVLQVCDRDRFLDLVQRHPVLSQHLTKVLVQRLKRANRKEVTPDRRMSIAVIPLHPGVEHADFSASFLKALGEGGSVLRLTQREVEARAGHLLTSTDSRLRDLRLLPWFEEQEALHDFVLYEADATFTPWTHRCVSQADRIVLVADANDPPDLGHMEREVEHVLEGARPPLHLVLLHPEDRDHPRNTRSWLAPRRLRGHHHVRRNRRSDVERVCRLLTGRALGVVLSGGGARGLAHIGVLGVLEELGIPVDAIGGTSAGSAIAGAYALGRSPEELRDAAHQDFVVGRPFKEYTLPVYSLASRHPLDAVCKRIAGDIDIADLWIPYFCTSSDLQTGEKVVHDHGPFWKAVRASMSLPGIVPPVIDGDRLLVDGGVLDNLPEEEMGSFCGGRVLAVDVSSGVATPYDFEYEDMPSPWRVFANRFLPWKRRTRVPTFIDVLTRTAIVSNTGQRDASKNVDLVLRPPVGSFGLLEFGAIDRIIELAQEYSREELQVWRARNGPGAGTKVVRA